MDVDVSTEDPIQTNAAEPPPAPEAPAAAAPEAPAAAPPPSETPPPPLARAPSQNGPALIIIGLIVAVALIAFVVWQAPTWFAPHPTGVAYSVEPYTPPSQLISTGNHVLGHAQPDVASPSVVIFGPGVALTVTGRVSRGFGNDWYAIAWNNQTAFIRQQDATPGTATAPPPTAPHVAAPPHEDVKPDADDENGFPTTDDTSAPPPSAGPIELNGVRWASRPGRRDYERAYPRRALDQNQSGHVTLDCVASGGGGLDCSVASELPRGYGFGEAAMGLSRQFRLEPTTSDGRSVAGGHIQIPMDFRAN